MFALTLLLIACANQDKAVESADPCADATYHLTWANWGDGFFANYCRACHSVNAPDRFDAPEGINFDTVEDVAQWNDLIRTAVLVDGTMPVGGGVYETDLEFLDIFLACGVSD